MKIKTTPRMKQLAADTMANWTKSFERRKPVWRGNVVSVVRDSPSAGSQVVRCNVKLRNGTIAPNIATGAWVIGVGSHVSIRGAGPIVGGDYEVARVHSHGRGMLVGNPQGYVSTPNIFEIKTRLIESGGTLTVALEVIVECIVEHWRGRIPTRYEVEILDNDLNLVQTIRSPQYERVAGTLYAQITAGSTSLRVDPYTTASPPSVDFPYSGGVLRTGAELIYYPFAQTIGLGRQFLSLDRGYMGTTPAIQYVGRDVSMVGVSFATQALLTNTVYKVRVIAKTGDNRVSTWSDVVTVLTDVDITPPTWSAGAGLAVATIGNAFRLTWNNANENNADLSHYNIQISDDNVTWGNIFNVGNGTSWEYRAVAGTIKFFRIQAEDFTGNTGYEDSPFADWSPSVRGALILTEEPNGGQDAFNLIANPKFTTNLTGYSIVSSSGTATITRDTAVYFDSSPSSMRWQEARGVIQSTTEITYTAINVTAGNSIYFRGYIRGEALTAGDTIAIGIRLRSGALVELSKPISQFVGTEIPTTGWFPIYFDAPIPMDVTTAVILISITNDAGSGTPKIWFDDFFLTFYNRGGAAFLIDANFSAAPAATSKYLKTTAAGLLTLQHLTVVGDLAQERGGVARIGGLNSFLPSTTNPLVTTSRNIGTYTVTVTSHSVPAGCRAVLVRAYGKVATANDGNTVIVRKQGNSDAPVIVRMPVGAFYGETTGWVPINTANEQIEFVVGGANQTACGLVIIGYAP